MTSSPPPMVPKKPSSAPTLSGSSLQTLLRSRPPSPCWIVSEPFSESVARVTRCIQTAFSELNLFDDQDPATTSKLQELLISEAFSDQREAAIAGAYALAKREEWQRLNPITDDLNTFTNACGKTLLMVAVSKGDKATAGGLVERGISAFSKTAQGTSALHVAAKRGDTEMMSIVRDTAGNVDKTDVLTRTPLHIAVYHNNVQAVRYLAHDLAAKLDSPAPYASGLWDEEPTTTEATLMTSPVTLAVLLGHTDCFDTMMQRIDVRTELTSGDIGNLCHVAVHFRQTAMLEHLLKNYSELAQRCLKGEDAKGLTPAGVAAATGDIDSLEVIYRYAPEIILAKDRCGRTPVHWAAEGLHTAVLEFYGKHIPPQIACFEELSTPIRGNAAKSPIAILQDLLEKSPHDLKVQQAASAAQRIMRQHKLGKLQSAEVQTAEECKPTHLERAAQEAFPIPGKRKHEVRREEILRKIEEAFTDNHLVVLHGITGTGKTRLASAFGRKQAEEKEVYWIEASVEGIVPSYIKLAKKLGLITEEGLKSSRGQEQAVDRVMKYFSKRSDCLLILDDVISEEELSFEGISLIPEGGAQVLLTRVLITSQSDLFSEGQLVQVEKLTEQEALELLRNTIKKQTPEELLSELSERLFYHPLLINMTGCYIRQMSLRQRQKPLGTIITEEIDRLKESSTHLPQGRKDQILKEVKKRWALNLARAKEEDTHVEKTLGICAHLAPKGIPLRWFEGKLRESFGILESFGFCYREQEDLEEVSIHALVQRISEGDNHKFLGATVEFLKKKSRSKKALPPEQLNTLTRHMDFLLNKSKQPDLEDLRYYLGKLYVELGDFYSAKESYSTALEKLPNKKQSKYKLEIGLCELFLGNYLEAYKLFSEMQKKPCEQGSPKLCYYMNIAAERLGDIGNVVSLPDAANLGFDDECYKKAAAVHIKCFRYKKARFREENPSNLQELTKDTQEIYEQALRKGNIHPLQLIALCFEELEDLKMVCEVRNQICSLLSKQQNKLATIWAYRNLGRAFGVNGEHQKALEVKQLAYKEAKNLRVKNPLLVAQLLNDCAYTEFDLECYEGSLEHLKAAEQICGENKQLLAQVLTNQGAAYMRTGKPDEALKKFKEAFETREVEMVKDGEVLHEDYITSINNMAWAYISWKKYPEAESWLKRALALEGSDFFRAHAQTHYLLAKLPSLEKSVRLNYAKKAYKMRSKLFSRGHRDVKEAGELVKKLEKET